MFTTDKSFIKCSYTCSCTSKTFRECTLSCFCLLWYFLCPRECKGAPSLMNNTLAVMCIQICLLLQLTWKGPGVCHHERHQLCWQFSIGRGEIWHGRSARVCRVYESGLTLDSLLSQCVRWTTTAFESMTVAKLREERITGGAKKREWCS